MSKPKLNPNCDGGGPCTEGEVRILPTGGDSNAILCASCHAREMTWRRSRNRELDDDVRFDVPPWLALRVYAEVTP